MPNNSPFYCHANFSKGILDKIRRLHKIYTLCAVTFFIFGHQVKTYGLISMKFVPQLCRNSLEDVTNFSKAILLSFVVQVDELHGKF